jgi:hypothetical protein
MDSAHPASISNALHRLRGFVLAPFLALSVLAAADQGVIRISAYPTVAVADGRSSITISAEIRDTSGRLAPNGTQVLFSTNFGYFREPIVQTSSGTAHATLVAGSIAGTAKVTAEAHAFNATSALEVEFVSDRGQLFSWISSCSRLMVRTGAFRCAIETSRSRPTTFSFRCPPMKLAPARRSSRWAR